MLPLPLRITNTPPPPVITTHAARVWSKDTNKTKKQLAADVVAEYLIGADDMAMVYVSPNPFSLAFEEDIELRKFDLSTHCTTSL